MLWFLGFLIFIAAIVAAGFLCIKVDDTSSLIFIKKNIPKSIVIILISIVVWYLLASVVIIKAGDRGAIFNSFTGVRTDKILGEGLHIVPKIINTVTIYDVYTRTWTELIPCLSSDGLPIDMDVSIRYRLNSDAVAKVKQNVGSQTDVEQKILIPTARSKMRDVAAKFTAQQAYASKRMELQKAYKTILVKFFESEDYLVAEQILVRKVIPPKDLTAKITETKVEEQNVIKQQNVLEAEKMKREQQIVKAQAEAEALRIKAKAISRNPKIIDLEWIGKWDGTLPTVMMGKGSIPMINLGTLNK